MYVGADLDTTFIYGNTALHWAAHLGDVVWLKVMLCVGVDPNREDKTGWPPLCATPDAAADVLLLLIAAGADPHHKDKCGYTVLDLARKYGPAKFHGLMAAAAARSLPGSRPGAHRAPE